MALDELAASVPTTNDPSTTIGREKKINPKETLSGRDAPSLHVAVQMTQNLDDAINVPQHSSGIPLIITTTATKTKG